MDMQGIQEMHCGHCLEKASFKHSVLNPELLNTQLWDNPTKPL